jgi:hypothetical protein
MIRDRRRHLPAAVLFALVALAGCSFPETDITAINTERVGDFAIIKASGTDAFTADVCVAEPSNADSIAERLVHQLANHGHRTISLNMYAQNGAVARFDWNGQTIQRQNVSGNANQISCDQKNGEASTRR